MLLSVGGAQNRPRLTAQDLLPVAIEHTIVLGASDSQGLFVAYELRPYFGYAKQVGPWQILIGMSAADDDHLVRGKLGHVMEVLEVRVFESDSVAARSEYSVHSKRVEQILGKPSACAKYQKIESTEFRTEWSVDGNYFSVVLSRGSSDERVAVQWGGSAPRTIPRTLARCP